MNGVNCEKGRGGTIVKKSSYEKILKQEGACFYRKNAQPFLIYAKYFFPCLRLPSIGGLVYY